MLKTLWWEDGRLRLIDQTRLPGELTIVDCRSVDEVARAIVTMQVRGAPALGATAAYGLAIAAQTSASATASALLGDLERAADVLRATRPTAVNLAWGLERVLRVARGLGDSSADELRATVLEQAHAIAAEDETTNRAMGQHGAQLVADGATILTHCNAGALACVSYGTALGVVRAAWEAGKQIKVFVDETRPFLQGARLTAWELVQEGIPATLITDNMAGHFLRTAVDLVVVGADRIAANGDVANKIGTYGVAVLAKENAVPFYVAAPTSTIDLGVLTGDQIPIEQRHPNEVTMMGGVRLAPEGVAVANPAFDVTPHRYVTAIITERGVVYPPFEENLRRIMEEPTLTAGSSTRSER
ncbi:MAG: S-methyl-5-thioribose-1-phosphate isomerase [Chloroflexi bacterium]|nr:S-methyl-5-thioribose-1-phosphate isomerase [Chloroflexota bacterium]